VIIWAPATNGRVSHGWQEHPDWPTWRISLCGQKRPRRDLGEDGLGVKVCKTCRRESEKVGRGKRW
jgi:hypothetical protein